MIKRAEFLKNLHDMTECNDHTGAAVYLAEYTDCLINDAETTHLVKWATFIQEEHNEIGHLPQDLLDLRSKVKNRCLEIIGEYLSEEYARTIAHNL